jgi:hypothetical protein
VINDVIERLAYVNNEELVLSDMIFFEPTDEDDAYTTYRRNLSRPQAPNDTTWHGAFKNLWKALLNTIKSRRIVQKEMFEQHPNAVDQLFRHCGLAKHEKLDREELEEFMHSQDVLCDHELSQSLVASLDRDQDNLAAYEEIYDALYGAE